MPRGDPGWYARDFTPRLSGRYSAWSDAVAFASEDYRRGYDRFLWRDRNYLPGYDAGYLTANPDTAWETEMARRLRRG